MERTQAGALARNGHHGDADAATKLFSELRMGWLLVDDARAQLINRVFGVSGSDSYVVTLIALALLAAAISDSAPIHRPAASMTDAALGAVVARELAYEVAGDWSRKTPYFGILVAGAMVARYRPLRRGVRVSVRGAKASSRKLRQALLGRYAE